MQSANYGDDLKVTVNFSNKDYTAGNEVIPALTAVLYSGKQRQVYNAAKVD